MTSRFLGFTAALILVGFNLGFSYPTSPLPDQTPGSYCSTQDPEFAGYRYEQKIAFCNRSVSTRAKSRIYQAYGIPSSCRGSYTIDHVIPLSIGGSNHSTNLWPEHKAIKALRQDMEYDLFIAVKENSMSQQEAVRILLDAKLNPPIDRLSPRTPCL